MHKNKAENVWKGKVLLSALLIVAVSCLGYATINGMNSPGENVTTVQSNEVTVNLTPGTILTPLVLAPYVELHLTILGSTNFSNIIIFAINGGKLQLIANSTFSDRPFYSIYFQLSHEFLKNGTFLLVRVDGTTLSPVPIIVAPSYTGLISDVILFAGIAMLMVYHRRFQTSSRRYWLLLPVFLVLAALYGQRYDDFFMIALGAHIAQGVNPYIHSAMIPGGLTWEYPPGFAPWSLLTITLFHLVTGTPIPSSQQLSYVATIYGDIYSAWQGLRGLNLFILYPLVKLPIVLAFLWMARIIEKETGTVPWKSWILNPFAVIVGVIWGQLDVLALAFMMQGVFFFKRDKSLLAGLFVSTGAVIKIFPVLILPYLLLRSRNRKAALLGVIVPVAIGICLYGLSGSLSSDIYTILFGRGIPTFFGVFFAQGLTWQLIVTDLGVRHFPSLFVYLFLPGYALLSYFAIKKGTSVYSYFLLSMLFFFLIYNVVNPQYLIWAIAVFILMGRKTEEILFSVIGGIYMLLDYSYTYFLNPDLVWNYESSALGQIEQLRAGLTQNFMVLLAFGLFSSAIFALYLYRYVKLQFYPGTRNDSPNT